jgi:NAD(P)-dependent dehydrogenase (short-subunit alcohol dehydrogenase family)
VLVTGVTPGGIGLETARAVAIQSPALIILAGRTSAKLQEAQKTVEESAPNTATRQLILDLSSIAKVRKAAEKVNSWKDVPAIDVVSTSTWLLSISVPSNTLISFSQQCGYYGCAIPT